MDRIEVATEGLIPPPRQANRSNTLSVLVADPVAHTRQIHATLLRSIGVRTILEAADGADALMLIRDAGPDVVLCDWCLGVFDAFAMARHVALNRWPAPAFVLVADNVTRGLLLEARRHGFATALAKPLSPGRLAERITRVATTRMGL